MKCASAACALVLLAAPASAQWIAPPPAAEAPAHPEFFPRYDFHLSADLTASGDKRFWWDTHFGGDFDLVDYGAGRLTFLADYQAVLGKQLRLFDPNQGNYLLEFSTSARARHTEVFAVFHHESRHLGDRTKIVAIAWNVLQARVYHNIAVRGSTIELRGDIGKVVGHAFVDYNWTADADAKVSRPIARHLSAYGRGYAETFSIRRNESTRGRQTGGRVEGGVHLAGRNGAIELFAGYERIVDADPFQEMPLSWAFAGFRLVNK